MLNENERAWLSFLKPAAIIAILWSCFQLYAVLWGFTDPMILYPVHTCFGVALGFLVKPLKTKSIFIKSLDYIAVILTACVALYMVFNFERMTTRIPFVEALEPLDYVIGIIAVVLITEVCRRTVGYSLTIVGIIAVIYAFCGSSFPGLFGHRGISLESFLDLEAFSPNGIYGLPISVSAELVFYFILFGKFLEKSGGGDLFSDLGIFLTGRFRGGAAKMSVVTSTLYGTISGSAVANVAVTGMFTIPLMKRTGFRSFLAGAVEAVSSTGGQLMPPIMGAAAFIMAQMLGISYWKVAMAAVIPAILYYVGVYACVDFIAMRDGLRGLSREEIPDIKNGILQRIHLLLPLVLIIYYIVSFTVTPVTAAVRSLFAVVIVSFLRRATWMGPKKILDAMEQTARESITVAIPCAMAGLVIGVVIYTGLGLKLTDILISLSGGILFLALLLVMLGVIVMGMGMPTSAAYLIAAILMGPFLIKLGVLPLAAHMFMLYFAVISMVTPPVALASFAAAGLAEADLWERGLAAFKMALPGFLIPFIVVYNPALILEGSAWAICWVTLTAIVGVVTLAASTTGFFMRSTRRWERFVLFFGAILLIVPEIITDVAGFIAIAVVLFNQLRRPSELIRKEAL
jgi:TRAP transporter 4TM/12TM fusion protein